MAENKKDPKETPDDDSDIGDDYGIRNDQVLDICDVIIEELWEKIYMERQNRSATPDGGKGQSPFTIEQLQSVAFTLNSVWDLVQRVLEVDGEVEYLLELEDEQNGEDNENNDDDEEDEDDNNDEEN